MFEYRFVRISDEHFSRYYSVYCMENIFLHYDWAERLRNVKPESSGYILLKEETPMGGVTLNKNHISRPFLIEPFGNKYEFWTAVLKLTKGAEKELFLDFVPDTHRKVLEEIGAKRKHGQYKMLRPTAKMDAALDPHFYFDVLKENEIDNIISVVYQAHLKGYTSTIMGMPSFENIARAVERQITAFFQTQTLGFGAVIKKRETHEMVAVCIAGIYPESTNDFATINQVSVLPEYRRKGLANAMIRRVISNAHGKSPVIILDVMDGNPSKKLYSELGFVAGCGYSDYVVES